MYNLYLSFLLPAWTSTDTVEPHLLLLLIDLHPSKSTEQFSTVVTPLVDLGKLGRSAASVGVDQLALMSKHHPLHVLGDVPPLRKLKRFQRRVVARLARRVTDAIVALHLDNIIPTGCFRRSTAALVSLLAGPGYALLHKPCHEIFLFAGQALQIVHHKRFIDLKRTPAGQLVHNVANHSSTLTWSMIDLDE